VLRLAPEIIILNKLLVQGRGVKCYEKEKLKKELISE
jgi:hypothetical protein